MIGYKFRGQREYNKKWTCGDLIQYQNGECAIIPESNRFSTYGREATEIINRDKVIPETVGQYTGLNDKNGEEIYNGDIVNFNNGFNTFIGEVCYGEYSYSACDEYDCIRLGYYVKCEIKKYQTSTGYPLEYTYKTGCVIGNIYENPELLNY